MPDDSVVPERAGSPTLTQVPKPRPNLRQWKWPIAGIVGLLVLWAVLRPPPGRPECPHDPGHETIAGKYTPVPEYHDCQRLVVKGVRGRLVYGKTAALFLSEAVIGGAIVGTPFIVTAGETRLVAQPLISLPNGIPIGTNVLAASASARFVPRNPGSPLPVTVTAADGTDLGTADRKS